jgi:hypothetical protein
MHLAGRENRKTAIHGFGCAFSEAALDCSEGHVDHQMCGEAAFSEVLVVA